MDSQENNMTHNEIWDDSALVNSWDEALKEYKKYHSIHAKGGKVEDKDMDMVKDMGENMGEDISGNGRDAKTETKQEGQRHSGETSAGLGSTDAADVQMPSVADVGGVGVGSAAAQTVLGSVRDEGLKKLLLSWYFAGYYTGFYEGQQQKQQQ